VIEAAARETCERRLSFECATLLAVWHRVGDRPDRVEAYLRGLRRKWNVDVLRQTSLDMLGVLLSGEPRGVPQSQSLARASVISKRFTSHYHHAFPFERRALSKAWDDCRGNACASARQGLELEVGALDRMAGGKR
jgi:hypothetical protein